MRHALDVGKNRLRKLVDDASELTPRLPLVHNTDSYALEDALTDGVVAPQPCDVFKGESLIYFFYGRPAFRANLNAEPTSLKHYFPVCLIFKPDWAAKIRRIFPFDSGAFQNGFYGAYLHEKMKLGDFALEANPSTPGKLVSRFFGSLPAYLKAHPEQLPKVDPAEFEAHSYLALIHAREGNAIDSRGSGIEVQVSDPVSIKDSVAAIVLPGTFADGVTGKKIKAAGIDILSYRAYERSRPNEYMSEITTLCFTYYLRTKLIKKGDM